MTDPLGEVLTGIRQLEAENKHLREVVARLTTFRDALLEITQAELARRGNELERLKK